MNTPPPLDNETVRSNFSAGSKVGHIVLFCKDHDRPATGIWTSYFWLLVV